MLGDRACAAGAVPLFYETWARKEGDAFYSQGWADNPAEAQAILRAEYNLVASRTCGWAVPIGDAWELTWTDDPGIELYNNDGSHPSLAGSYLAALEFFEAVTMADPVGAWAPNGVDGATAATLQANAAATLPAP